MFYKKVQEQGQKKEKDNLKVTNILRNSSKITMDSTVSSTAYKYFTSINPI